MLYCENKAETKQRECAAAAGGDAAECQRESESRVESGFLYFQERLNQVLPIHSDDGTFRDIGETITGQPHQH